VQDIVRKLDAVVATCTAVLRNNSTHDLVNDRQHLILAVSQLVHETRATLRILTTVKTIQLCCNRVQLLVGVVELSKK